MPDNPRRRRIPGAPEAVPNRKQITDALGRAVALRRRTAVDTGDVRAIGLTLSEATRSTEHRRAPS